LFVLPLTVRFLPEFDVWFASDMVQNVDPGGVKAQRGGQTADACASAPAMDMAPPVRPDVLPPGRRWSR
jgi:hypothetical protein